MTDDPIARMKQDFIADVSETLDKVSHSLAALGPAEAPSRAQVDWLFRTVHSLKGTSGMFELHEVSALAGSVEDLLELARSGSIEIDAAMLELLIEAFDELAILLQQAKGEKVQGSWSGVRSKLERLVQSLSDVSATGEDNDRRGLRSGLPADLEIVLSSEELAAIKRRLDRGSRVCKVVFEIDADRPSEHEEVVLRRLQNAGEIISVLPPGSEGIDSGKRTISLVYAPTEGATDLGDLVSAYGATVTDIVSEENGPDAGSDSPASGVSSSRPGASEDRSSQPASSLSVKVDIGVLDTMMNTVSELYSVRLGLLGVARRLPHTDETRRLRDDLLKLGLILNNRVGSLEESMLEVRLVPVSLLFERYRGEVRRLARQSGKKIGLEFEGEGTRIDRAMLDNLHDPLLHIIRNAVDHGIESPSERQAEGKREKGRILLRARQEANHICLEVEDDGRGVDSAKVRQKAIEKGIRMAATAPPLSLIFEPGMSTRGDVSDISGRGVGLDAAKTKLESMRGMITVDSTRGQGARFSVYVPLTLAISRGVLVEENGLPAVVPLRSVIEIIALRGDLIRETRQTGVLMHRGLRIKALALSEMLKVRDCREAKSAVVLGVGDKRRALVAQKVAGETDIVSRPLPEVMVAPGFIAGATELHDGRPAIIIQPEDFLRERSAAEGPGRGIPYQLFDSSTGSGWLNKKAVDLLIFQSGHVTYGIGLEFLKAVISLRSLTEVPVLGDPWQGVFFHRGMCHGLLRLGAGMTPLSEVHSVAILTSPERCGIGISEICGHFQVPVSDIEITPDDGGSMLLHSCGRLRWEGREVTIISVGTGPACRHGETLSTTGRKR